MRFPARGRIFVIVFRIETRNDDLLDLDLDQFFNVDQVLDFVGRNQGNRRSLLAGTTGTANACLLYTSRCV